MRGRRRHNSTQLNSTQLNLTITTVHLAPAAADHFIPSLFLVQYYKCLINWSAPHAWSLCKVPVRVCTCLKSTWTSYFLLLPLSLLIHHRHSPQPHLVTCWLTLQHPLSSLTLIFEGRVYLTCFLLSFSFVSRSLRAQVYFFYSPPSTNTTQTHLTTDLKNNFHTQLHSHSHWHLKWGRISSNFRIVNIHWLTLFLFLSLSLCPLTLFTLSGESETKASQETLTLWLK